MFNAISFCKAGIVVFNHFNQGFLVNRLSHQQVFFASEVTGRFFEISSSWAANTFFSQKFK